MDSHTTLLSAAVGDAERWLARWLREHIESADSGDVREINYAITALRRLIDARKAWGDLQRDEHTDLDRTHPDDVERALRRAVESADPGAATSGDPDALPG